MPTPARAVAGGILTGSERAPGRLDWIDLALAVDLQIAESAHIEPVPCGRLHAAQEHALAGSAAHNDSRSVNVDHRLPEDPDRAAVLASSDRCDDIEAEQFPQRSCHRVSVEMGYSIACDSSDVLILEARIFGTGRIRAVVATHRVPPVPPKRSVLIDPAGYPACTSHSATV